MSGAGRGLYTLVAWPPPDLAAWMTDVQREHGLASFGAPHLSLRTPFAHVGDEGDLLAACAETLRGVSPFEVRLRAWRRFPHTIFLELHLTPELRAAHERALAGLPAKAAEHDGGAYLPHLTLALGVCPWYEDEAWDRVGALAPPVVAWTVDAFALTLEDRGEVVELGRYPLAART